ncbi:MAG: oxidoreductase [Bryobacteraceae bacterium]|jgi:F420-non-reducing hydrogenase small subunit
MPEKPKVAFYWCASCGGCEEAVLDLAERFLDVAGAIDIVFWPVALDFKRKDVEALPDGSVFAAFINGAVRNSEQEEMAQLLRRKAKVVIAFGSCAQLGGIPGLANLYSRADIISAAYLEPPTMANPDHVLPAVHSRSDGHALELPVFQDRVRALDQVVEVDYYVPGCPPMPKIVHNAVETLLGAELPPRGSVLAPDLALCDECPRKDTKPEKLSFTEFKRPHQVLIDEKTCLLAQGLVCMGPATRGGCEAVCVQGNMPCGGCGGPMSRVRDQGAKMLSALASLVEGKEPEEIERTLATIPDPVGTFYRYSLPASLLQAARQNQTRAA